MKIVQLTSSNIKRLKAVELALDKDKNLVLITGKNGQGKSSVLDSIWYALGGKKAVPGKPIREGEEKAEVTIDLEGYIVTRTFTPNGSYLKVVNKEGQAYSNPQEFLNYIIGNLSFDPLAFAKFDSKKQVAELSKIVGLDFNEHEAKKKELTQERLIISRELKNLPNLTEEEIEKASELLREKEKMPSLHNMMTEYNAAVAKISEYEEAQRRIPELEAKIKELQEELAKWKKVKKPEVDLKAMEERIKNVEKLNENISKADKIMSDYKTVIEKKAAYDKLTQQIRELEEEKKKKLSEAKMPIEGLSWNEDTVLFNGIPFDQLSSAEQLKVSMAIAMASNPKLKVILIRDGSLLDSDNLKVIEEMAKDKDFSVWVEKVDDSGQVGIYIEDGEVKKINN